MLGTISFTGGGQTAGISDYIFIDDTGSIYCYNPAVSIKISKTGLISGKFPYNDSSTSKVSFNGVVLQGTTNAVGTFSGGGVTGTVKINCEDESNN